VIAPSPAVLIGCSWGAMLGLSYAARYPERVSCLALVGCGTYDEASRTLLRQSLRERLSEGEARRIHSLQEQCACEQNAARRDRLFAEIGDAFMRAESYELAAESEPEREDIPVDAEGNVETWSDVLRLQREEIEPNSFTVVTARVLMIHGDVDPHPGPATRNLLRRYIPQLEYIDLGRCGHEPWRERYARDRFLEILRGWISAA
jgi:pimeloyl-ACP methyl ester carboxylesterase